MSARNIIGQQSLVGVQPIINNNHFTFVKILEDNWESIYDELLEILKYRDLIPSFHEISKEQYKISEGEKWKTFAFFSFGHKFKYNCSYAPNTVKLLECIPNLQSAWFSVIAPGYHVPKHKGITRGILRSHLGLSIPNNPKECFMDVGNDRIYWEQGKVVVFDDSFEHEVWNNTDQERIVLLFDFDRPMKKIGCYIHDKSMKISFPAGDKYFNIYHKDDVQKIFENNLLDDPNKIAKFLKIVFFCNINIINNSNYRFLL